MLCQPSFLIVEQGNGAFNEFINGLVGSALNVLLDHFFQLGAQVNLHEHQFTSTSPKRREISLYADRPFHRSEMGRKKSIRFI